MTEKKVKINYKLGLHARPASLMVQTSSKFKADISIMKAGVEVNGKSIMSLMMLAAENGSELTIKANGSDEADAVKCLSDLIENSFKHKD